MFDELKNNLTNSYAPYSNFNVSSCLVTKEGRKFFGVNIENASYGATICAERVAITKAISEGEDSSNFKEIHILSSSEKYAMPCFLCRQVFVEFFNEDVKVIVYNINGDKEEYSLADICPLPFSKGDLE